jgi:hypothetical protein
MERVVGRACGWILVLGSEVDIGYDATYRDRDDAARQCVIL